MSRTDLKELMKKGPSLTYIAEQLNISRPTLYRHMDNYMKGNDRNVNQYLREYFDKVVMGQFSSDQEAMKELEQIRFFMDAEADKGREDFEREWREFENDSHSFAFAQHSLPREERLKKMEEMDKRRDELEAKAKELGIDFNRYLFDEDPEILKWNEGEIRSTCLCPFDGTMVLIDADFEKCRSVTVEVIVKVSGEDFVMARVRPEEDRRFAVIGFLRENVDYKYRLKWNEGEKVRYAGPYPIKYKAY